MHGTNCDFLTPWLRSTEPSGLHPDDVNTTTFDGKIGTFEVVRVQLRPRLVTMDYPCSAVMSRDIMQPCMRAMFSFNTLPVCRVLLQLHWGVSNHGLSWSFTAGFYFEKVSCDFNRIQSR